MANQIIKYSCEQLDGVEISCLMVKGEPWFCGVEVAKALGYERPRQTIYKLDLKYKSTFQFLLSMLRVSSGETQTKYDLNTSWINEAGLYKLILKSTLKSAEIFQDWVCSEVLPSIRKTGGYTNDYYYKKAVATKDDVKELAHQYRAEDVLHYQVVDHITHTYPDAILHAGLGEHLTTKHAGLDAQLKGYTKGEPDITITRKLPNGFQNVLAIELKAQNRECKADPHQDEYHKKMKEMANIDTIVGNRFDKVIIDIHDYYRDIMAKAQLPAIQDKPKDYDFSSNNDTKYWCNKLKNKSALLDECTKRSIDTHEIRFTSNKDIASVLITFDKNH